MVNVSNPLIYEVWRVCSHSVSRSAQLFGKQNWLLSNFNDTLDFYRLQSTLYGVGLFSHVTWACVNHTRFCHCVGHITLLMFHESKLIDDFVVYI